MRIPYMYTSLYTTIHSAIGVSNDTGLAYQESEGEHTIWATRVPFLPAMTSDDFTRMGRERTQLIMRRQFRFIYDLVRAKDHHATFELRFIATPSLVPGQPAAIDIVFFGKVFSSTVRGGQALGEQLWDKFSCNFPLEDPYNYPLQPVTDPTEFAQYYQPLPFDQLHSTNMVELRKFEDMPIPANGPVGHIERIGDYIAHPFVPSVDFGPMGRFFAALAAQPNKCYVGVSLRPTHMFDTEIHNCSFMLGMLRKTIEDVDRSEYIRARAKVGLSVYEQLLQEREQLAMIRIYVIGEHEAPYGLIQALGSEVMGNAANHYPTQWTTTQPSTPDELALAIENVRYFEHNLWGSTIAVPPLARLRYLVTAQEAYGAFRLPIPPESGYIPGILVKNEPFVAPIEERESAQATPQNVPRVRLGQIYHRGYPSAQWFDIPLNDLTRHALIAGSTGSGKTTTIKHILTQLWSQHRVPFMVLYPIDKPDYRDLALAPDLRDSILIFTLGDEGTSPFRFNPFEVVEGMLIKTHMSRLMRVFTAAFSLHDPLPMIYREALRQVYRQYGWDIAHDRGRSDGVYPIMSDFYQAINAVTALLKYGREMQDNIRQASVIRIGDLLENVGHVVNVRKSMPLATILRQPTLVELGRIGSSNDTALLMGFILLQFTAELERSNTRSQRSNRPHITVVEEAHRLMSDKQGSSETGSTSQSAASEDFSNILAEVRGYGAGIMIAEQIPTLLVKGAIGNTYTKIMHWLEDPPSFDLFSNVMNLNEAQRLYARSLTPGFAIVRNRYGRPVHISIPPFAQVTDAADAATDDATIATFMRRQRQQFDITDVSVTSWEGGLEAQSASDPVPAFRQEVDPALAHLCSASDSTLVWKIPLEYIAKQVPHLNAAAKAHDWVQLRELCSQALHDHRIDSSAARIKCYLVRVASLPQGKGPNAGKTFYSLYDHYRQAIQHI